MGRKNTVDLTPDKSLVKKIGLAGYRTEQAIAELIDNAIDARRRDGVTVRVTLDFAGKSITVDDDGEGMDLESLRDAMTIARSYKHGSASLGMFGFGMKSACSALGRHVVIQTSKEDAPDVYGIEYDESAWLEDEARSWDNFEIDQSAKARPWHGTQIRIGRLNVPLYPLQAKTLLDKFGLRYSQYIPSENVTIRVNDTECDVVEPELDGDRHEINIKAHGKSRITGWVGILKKRSIAHYGFSLYRGNRIIRSSDKFGLRNHPALAKLTGELHLDHVPVNYQKTKFLVDSREYIESKNAFADDPVVKSLMQRAAEQKKETIRPFVDYVTLGDHGGKIKPSIGMAAARSMLKGADSFKFDHGGLDVKFDFEDGSGDGLYAISAGPSGHTITIDRNSKMFSMARNPSMLLAMVWEEARLLMGEPGKHDEFVRARNESWERFMASALRDPAPARAPQKAGNPLLSDRLAFVQSVLAGSYRNRYQFTALCVLEPHLHYGQKNMYYTILTERRAGGHLQSFLSSNVGDGLIVLHKPTRQQLALFPSLPSNDAIIVIREYANIQSSTVASYEKAVLDLYYEHRRGLPLGLDEIEMVVDSLRHNSKFSLEKLRRMAKHRNLDPDFYKDQGR